MLLRTNKVKVKKAIFNTEESKNMKNYKITLDEQRKVICNSAISNVFNEMATLISKEQLEIIKRYYLVILLLILK